MSYAYPYIVIQEPVNLAVSLDTVKDHLKIDNTDSDAELTLLIKAATGIAENYTRRIFINTGFRTYRCCFLDCFELKRSKFQSLQKYEYLQSGSFVTIDSSLYYITDDTAYSKIILNNGASYPDDLDVNEQAIKIEFTAGYGADEADIPYDLRVALLNHIAALFENRGDCDNASSITTVPSIQNLPATSRIVYDLYRLQDVGYGDCGVNCGCL